MLILFFVKELFFEQVVLSVSQWLLDKKNKTAEEACVIVLMAELIFYCSLGDTHIGERRLVVDVMR